MISVVCEGCVTLGKTVSLLSASGAGGGQPRMFGNSTRSILEVVGRESVNRDEDHVAAGRHRLDGPADQGRDRGVARLASPTRRARQARHQDDRGDKADAVTAARHRNRQSRPT